MNGDANRLTIGIIRHDVSRFGLDGELDELGIGRVARETERSAHPSDIIANVP